MTIHLFISEALVSVAMYTHVKLGGGPENQRISYQELVDQVLFLSRVSLHPDFDVHVLICLALPWGIHIPNRRSSCQSRKDTYRS